MGRKKIKLRTNKNHVIGEEQLHSRSNKTSRYLLNWVLWWVTIDKSATSCLTLTESQLIEAGHSEVVDGTINCYSK